MSRLFQSTHLHEVWQIIQMGMDSVLKVSIHTPTWGVTCLNCCGGNIPIVSIHTPTWGVTIPNIIRQLFFQSFNPHTYMRCDYGVSEDIDISYVFQSTHLHEVWLIYIMTLSIEWKFQSTHLHEVWHIYQRFHDLRQRVSIHTPTWGVTVYRVVYYKSIN